MCANLEHSCTRCTGPLSLLGRLGNLVWLRCRNCGWDTAISALDAGLEDEGDD